MIQLGLSSMFWVLTPYLYSQRQTLHDSLQSMANTKS